MNSADKQGQGSTGTQGKVVALHTDNPDKWSKERVELIRRTICPKGIPNDEFELFIEQCKRSGLDPLLKEAFCVGRRQNFGTKDKPNWGTKYEFQPSEAGMLARAERFPDFKGIQASAVYAEDEIIVDQGEGKVVHRFNPAKRKGALVGAWARVVRAEKLPVVVWLDFAGYVQQTPLWAKIPTTMIEKCARVAALRKGYPEAFGGLYVREEMPAEEYEHPDESPYESVPTKDGSPAKASYAQEGSDVRMRTLTDHMKQAGIANTKEEAKAFIQKTMGDKPYSKWTPEDWGKFTNAVVTEEKRLKSLKSEAAPESAPADAQHTPTPAPESAPEQSEEAAASEPAPTPASTPAPASKSASTVVAFGPNKGKTASELSDDELSETIDLAHEKLMEQPKAKWAKAMRENLAALEAETELRCRVPSSLPASQAEAGAPPESDTQA